MNAHLAVYSTPLLLATPTDVKVAEEAGSGLRLYQSPILPFIAQRFLHLLESIRKEAVLAHLIRSYSQSGPTYASFCLSVTSTGQ